MLKTLFAKILISAVVFICLDVLWLGYFGKQLYLNTIGPLLRLSGTDLNPNWLAAVVVYIALITGIVAFVLPKAHGLLLPSLLWGALFGLVAYGTYDFTNLAVLSGWSIKISIIDTIWGMVICGLTSFLTTLITR